MSKCERWIWHQVKCIFFLLLAGFLISCSDSGSSQKETVDELPQFETHPSLRFSEDDKIDIINRQGSAARLQLVPSIELQIANGPGKPSALPGELSMIDQQGPAYTQGLRKAFVEKGGDEQRWFALTAKKEATARIIWQVTDTPFSGQEQDWQQPLGLLAEGILSANAVEFSVDFSSAIRQSKKWRQLDRSLSIIDSNARLSPLQTLLYARAIAVNSDDEPLGALGKGVEIIYGNAVSVAPIETTFQLKFPLLSAKRSGLVSTNGEYPNTLEEAAARFYSTDLAEPWYFRPNDYPGSTHTLYLQVSTVPPTAGPDSWRDPAGLVYEKKVSAGEPDFDNFANSVYHALPVDVHSIATTVPTIFYVRVVALSNGSVAGTLVANYSKTVELQYGNATSEFTYYVPPEVVTIDAPLPTVRLLDYQPIRWEYPDWMYYYEVVRQPTNRDYYSTLPASMVPNPNQLVDGLLPGTVIKFSPPPPEDKSWLKEAWDAVSGFFSSMIDFLQEVADWVSNAYADIKADLILFVAENLPLVPDQFRDELEDALTYMVDYGLASVGVPPSLPNFDELSEMGTDYLASTALAQAGIPSTSITTDTVKELAGGISDEMSAAANAGNAPNPLNWNFVRQYSGVMYRPAYMRLEITNPYPYATPAGRLQASVFRNLDSSELGDSYKMWMYSAYGGSLYFELYRPVGDVVIPRLLPGQTMVVPVFFEEYTGASYPWHPLQVSQSDFLRMYNHFDYFTFSTRIDFQLPPAQAYASLLGLPSDKVYTYNTTSRGAHFTGDPAASYSPLVH